MDKRLRDAICLGAGQITQIIVQAAGIAQHRKRVHPYLLERRKKSRFATDFEDYVHCEKLFKENFHMSYQCFQDLLSHVEVSLQPKRNTHPNHSISPKEKLAIVLEYFACGTLQRHMASVYRISKQHFGQIIDEVCNAIINALHEAIPKMTPAEMLKVSETYHKWNFPKCVGAIDGKHIAVKCPSKSGSLFFNYKGFFSIIMLAAANGDYEFTYLDVGAYGSEGDANVFHQSSLGKSIMDEKLQFPSDATVNGNVSPFVFVADDAFPLHKRIMKPFTPRKNKRLEDSQLIFNYRLSRARRCIENAFGILCSKFYCLARKMFCNPAKVQKIVTACCYLHNFLIKHHKEEYCPSNYADKYNEYGEIIRGEYHSQLPIDSLFSSHLPFSQTGRNPNLAKSIRENLREFFISDTGSIPWQRRSIFLD